MTATARHHTLPAWCSYKVTAVSQGGESPKFFCRIGVHNQQPLVINGFDRGHALPTLPPTPPTPLKPISDEQNAAPYIRTSATLARYTTATHSWMDDDAPVSATARNHEPATVAVTFDYPAIHGAAILKAGSFVSVSNKSPRKGEEYLRYEA